MAKIPFNFGGGSGNGSDDCTAESDDVLTNVTAIYNGSDDEPEYGTMPNHSGVSLSAPISLDTSNSRVVMTFPQMGKYTTGSKLYSNYKEALESLDISEAKIATGNTILGAKGTYTGLGDATVDDVLSGRTFSTANLSNATGTMVNVSATDTAKSMRLSSGTMYACMTHGAHITNTSSNYPQVALPQATVASTIGLSASQIAYGNTILGISGTSISPGSINSSGLDLYAFGREGITCDAHSTTYNSGSVISSTAGIVTKASTCVTFCTIGNVSYTGTLVFSGASIALGSYSTIHVQARGVGDTHNWTMRFYYASSPPTSYSQAGNGTLAGEEKTVSLSTGSSSTTTINISSLSGSYYLTFYPYNVDATWAGMIVEHIWLT